MRARMILRISVATLTLGGLIVATLLGGYAVAYEVIIPAWVTGIVAGLLIWCVAGFFAVHVFLPAASDFIDSPAYRNYAKDIFREYGHWPILPALGIAMLTSYLWKWGWVSLALGVGIYLLIMTGTCIVGFAYLRRAVGSAVFVADTYSSAGVPLDQPQS